MEHTNKMKNYKVTLAIRVCFKKNIFPLWNVERKCKVEENWNRIKYLLTFHHFWFEICFKQQQLQVYKNRLSLFALPINADAEVENVDAPDAEVTGQRVTRDVLDHAPVNDYVSWPGTLCHINQEPYHEIQWSNFYQLQLCLDSFCI